MAGFNEKIARAPNEVRCQELVARRSRLAGYGFGSGILALLLAQTSLGPIFFFLAVIFIAAAYMTNVTRKKKGEAAIYE